MKKENFNEKINLELNCLIEELIANAKETTEEIYWETLLVGVDQIDHAANETIYRGNTGIMLFFLELYRNNPIPRYFDIIKKSCKWIENYCLLNPTNYIAFYTGRAGVAFAFFKVYEVFKDVIYLESALKIAGECSLKLIGAGEPKIDLINGASGTLLVFLHLYNHSPSEHLLQQIKDFTLYILNHLEIDSNGIYWQRQNSEIKGLCGHSHGSSGIGWVLLEVGRLFNDQNLIQLSHQTLYYENAHYNKEFKNWPDFRRDIYDESSTLRYMNSFLQGNFGPLEKPSNMVSWCHGSPGIGLNRLRFAELTGINLTKLDVKRALRTTKKDLLVSHNKPVHILCHGTGGNAYLFIEAYRLKNKAIYLDFAKEMAVNITGSHKSLGFYYSGYSTAGEAKDYSLFMGQAGIGYFLLSCLYPMQTYSYLLPTIRYRSKDFLPFLKKDEIAKILLEKTFRYSFDTSYLKNIAQELDLTNRKLYRQLEDLMFKNTKGTFRYSCFKLEKKALKIDHQLNSFCYDYIEDRIRMTKVEKINLLANDEFDSLKVIVSNKVIVGKHKLLSYSTNYLLIHIGYSGRKSFFVNDLIYSILRMVKMKVCIRDLKERLYSSMEIDRLDRDKFEDYLNIQLKELFKAGFISLGLD